MKFCFTFNDLNHEAINVINRMLFLYERTTGHEFGGHPLVIFNMYFAATKLGFMTRYLTNDAEYKLLQAMRAVKPDDHTR